MPWLPTPIFLFLQTTDRRLKNGAKLRLGPKTLGKESSPASTLEKVTCLPLVQQAQPATPTARSSASNTFLRPIAYKPNLLQICVTLSQPQNQSPTTRAKWITACNLGSLEFFPMPIDVAHTSSRTYKLWISYRILTTFMHTSVCLFDTGTRINIF